MQWRHVNCPNSLNSRESMGNELNRLSLRLKTHTGSEDSGGVPSGPCPLFAYREREEKPQCVA